METSYKCMSIIQGRSNGCFGRGLLIGVEMMEDSEYILWWRQEVFPTNILKDFPKLPEVHTCHCEWSIFRGEGHMLI